jgi:hypothetical protein
VQGHPQLVPHPEEEQPSLDAVDGALPDDLVEALRVQLASHRADAGLSGLTLFQLLIQLLLKTNTNIKFFHES